jgi:hypothetical protein
MAYRLGFFPALFLDGFFLATGALWTGADIFLAQEAPTVTAELFCRISARNGSWVVEQALPDWRGAEYAARLPVALLWSMVTNPEDPFRFTLSITKQVPPASFSGTTLPLLPVLQR